MRRGLRGGYELDDDPGRLDLDLVHDFLSRRAYWALGRSRETVERSIAGSQRVVGLYDRSGQVGFARVVSDGAVIAYLADVFVIEQHRGRGLGLELAREAIDGGPHRDLLWRLSTTGARGLYEKLGFSELVAPPTLMGRRAAGA